MVNGVCDGVPVQCLSGGAWEVNLGNRVVVRDTFWSQFQAVWQWFVEWVRVFAAEDPGWVSGCLVSGWVGWVMLALLLWVCW